MISGNFFQDLRVLVEDALLVAFLVEGVQSLLGGWGRWFFFFLFLVVFSLSFFAVLFFFAVIVLFFVFVFSVRVFVLVLLLLFWLWEFERQNNAVVAENGTVVDPRVRFYQGIELKLVLLCLWVDGWPH